MRISEQSTIGHLKPINIGFQLIQSPNFRQMNNPPPPDRVPPSTTSIILATALIAITAGYFIGQGASLGLFSTKKSNGSKTSWPNSYDVTIHPDSSDEELMEHLKGGKKNKNEVKDSEDEDESDDDDDDDVQGELNAFDAKKEEQYKLVLCVRTDLGMTKGTHSPPYISPCLPTTHSQTTHPIRQNRSPSIPRHPRLLQIPPPTLPQLAPTTPVGIPRPNEDRRQSQVRGRAAGITGESDEFGALCKGHS